MRDPIKDIEFWLTAMNQPNVSKENVALINKCLERELKNFLDPLTSVLMHAKTKASDN